MSAEDKFGELVTEFCSDEEEVELVCTVGGMIFQLMETLPPPVVALVVGLVSGVLPPGELTERKNEVEKRSSVLYREGIAEEMN